MRIIATLLLLVCLAQAETKRIRVFVALCDNKTQGIVPVGEKIGNGDDPGKRIFFR